MKRLLRKLWIRIFFGLGHLFLEINYNLAMSGRFVLNGRLFLLSCLLVDIGAWNNQIKQSAEKLIRGGYANT
jgi:hypothetical protein